MPGVFSTKLCLVKGDQNMSIELFIQHFFNALALGSLYGLIAIGYTMVYGILRLINFAHGDIFMLGAYFVFFATISFMPAWAAALIMLAGILIFYYTFRSKNKTVGYLVLGLAGICAIMAVYYGFVSPGQFTPPWALALCFAIFATSACGIAVDRIAYRPLRDAPRISALISAIGMSFFIQSLCVVLFTGSFRQVLTPEFLGKPWRIEFVLDGADKVLHITPLAAYVPIVTIILVAALMWVIHKTKPGLAMRAISRDIETTRLMGVSVNRIIAFTFGLGSALAAVAGILWALRYSRIDPYMGVIPGLKAFIAAVFGGIGSVPGALIGGLLLGFIEIMVIAFFPTLSGYRDAFAFILLIVILLAKPTGLMGEKMEDKI